MRRIVVLFALGCSTLAMANAGRADSPPEDAPLPAPINGTLSLLAQTAAVVEGTASDLISEYTDETGPWTRIEFSDVVVHLGSLGEKPPAILAVRQRGGDYPDGRIMLVSDMPRFTRGGRYLLFLRNTAWRFSPIVGDAALRVESIAGVEALITTDGEGVLGFGEEGLKLSRQIWERLDLSGAPPLPLKDVEVPKGLVGAAGFIAATTAQLKARGLTLAGTFYDQPVDRAKEFATEPPAQAPAGK